MDKRKSYRIRHAAKIRLASKAWRLENPHKRKAHNAVRRAVLAGAINKPERCESCGALLRLHAHHHDYARPLDVRWLCAACHSREHNHAFIHAPKTIHFGGHHPRAKLAESDVSEIKRRVTTGSISRRSIAREFGVSERNIRLILKGETWKHTKN